MYLLFNTRAECDAFVAKIDSNLGYPSPGRLASDNSVVDPDGITRKGWTETHTRGVEHPSNGQAYVFVKDDMANAVYVTDAERALATDLATLKTVGFEVPS